MGEFKDAVLSSFVALCLFPVLVVKIYIKGLAIKDTVLSAVRCRALTQLVRSGCVTQTDDQ